jgi:hypothetical protein
MNQDIERRRVIYRYKHVLRRIVPKAQELTIVLLAYMTDQLEADG